MNSKLAAWCILTGIAAGILGVGLYYIIVGVD